MRKTEFFVGNLNLCAQGRLKAAGIPLTEELRYNQETYTGAWITERCLRKLWLYCDRQGDAENAFDLFRSAGGPARLTRIASNNIPQFLGMVPSKKQHTFADNQLQDFGQQTLATA